MAPIKRRAPEENMIREAQVTRDDGYRMLQTARRNFDYAVRRGWEFGMAESRRLRHEALNMINWANGFLADAGGAAIDTYGDTSVRSNAAFRALEFVSPGAGLPYTASRLGYHFVARRARRLSIPSVGSTHSGATEVSQRNMHGTQSTAVAAMDVDAEHGFSIRGPAVVGKRNKKAHNKKTKRVKVSKQFKMKVEKALEKTDKIHGSFTQYSYSTIPLSNFLDLKQVVCQPGYYPSGTVTGAYAFFPKDAWGACGNVADMLHMTSVLFNAKPDSQGVRDIVDQHTLGLVADTTNINVAVSNVSGVNVSAVNTTFFVKEIHDIYRVRNNSGRAVNMILYECKYKSPIGERGTVKNVTGANTNQAPNRSTPLQLWTDALSDQNKLAANIAAITPETYGVEMLNTPMVKKYFNVERKHVLLEPGQEYEFKIIGPQGVEVNTTQCYTDGAFQDCQKFTVMPVFVFYLDMVSVVDSLTMPAANNGVTRGSYVTGLNNFAQALLFERKRQFKVACPPQAGATVTIPSVPENNQQIMLNDRRNCYFHTVYTDLTAGSTVRYDDQQPQTSANE